MTRIAVTVLAVLVLSLTAAAQASKIIGVWKLVEVKTTGEKPETITTFQPNIFIYTKGHYSIVRVSGTEPRPVADDSSKLTADELRKTFVTDFVANAGTYEIKGDRITMRPIVAKSPGYMQPGTFITQVFKIEGKFLTMTTEANNTGPVKNPTTSRYERVE